MLELIGLGGIKFVGVYGRGKLLCVKEDCLSICLVSCHMQITGMTYDVGVNLHWV